jgi:hypothetical protein
MSRSTPADEGGYRFSSLVKKLEFALSFASPEKIFFYIHDVITHRKKKKAMLIISARTFRVCNSGNRCTSRKLVLLTCC